MNDKITKITSERAVTEDFAPYWQFSGVVYYNEPLSGKNREHAKEIVAMLTNRLKNEPTNQTTS